MARLRRTLIASGVMAAVVAVTPRGPTSAAALGHALATLDFGPGSATVYTPSQLQAAFRHASPDAWQGRTVLLRATVARRVTFTAEPSRMALTAPLRLVDPNTTWNATFVPVVWGPPDPLLARLRALPLLRRLLHPPQRLAWDRPAAYRLALYAIPCVLPHHWTCYGGLLLDADPRGA